MTQVTPQSLSSPLQTAAAVTSPPFDLKPRWDKDKEVQYVHLCDPPSPHYCQMATYLWKEVSTNIDPHVSESTKRWKNRRVFSISLIQQICCKSDKVIYKSKHKESQESITDKGPVHLLQRRRRSDEVTSPFGKERFHQPGRRCPGSEFENTLKISASVVKASPLSRGNMWSQHRHNNKTPGCG